MESLDVKIKTTDAGVIESNVPSLGPMTRANNWESTMRLTSIFTLFYLCLFTISDAVSNGQTPFTDAVDLEDEGPVTAYADHLGTKPLKRNTATQTSKALDGKSLEKVVSDLEARRQKMADYEAAHAPESDVPPKKKKSKPKGVYLSQDKVNSQRFDYAGLLHFGANNIIGLGIKLVTRSFFSSTPVSHTGILLRDRDTGEWYCMEANGSAGEVMKGLYPFIRITKLDDLVNYSGFIAVEPLSFASFTALKTRNMRLEEQEQHLIDDQHVDPALLMGVSDNGEHYVDHNGNKLGAGHISMTAFARWANFRAYEKNVGQLLKSVVNLNGKNGLKAVMCSTLAYACGVMMGVIRVDEDNPLASNVLPIELVNSETMPGFANDNYQRVSPAKHIDGRMPSEYLNTFFSTSERALAQLGVTINVIPHDEGEKDEDQLSENAEGVSGDDPAQVVQVAAVEGGAGDAGSGKRRAKLKADGSGKPEAKKDRKGRKKKKAKQPDDES